jgi:L-ascorbate metabolism protein UlaG (beta-lactamase superfamily)
MKVTYLGHACFIVETQGKKLLFDPFISGNPLLQEPGKSVDIESIEADYILITHGHFDHVADAEAIAHRTGAVVVSIAEVVNWFGQKDIKGHPMNTGGQWTFDFGTVKLVNAVHSSSFPDGTYAGNPVGFVIWNEEGCFYHSGDTALTMDMQLIPMTCPKLDFAILSIGGNFTMNFTDAVIAAKFIDCAKIIGCHYDTFGYIKIDHTAAEKAFSDIGKELILLPIGESRNI